MWGHWTYLVLIVVWAGPLIVLQWLVGADVLLRRWRVLLPGVLIPTLYLTVADSFALHAGTWAISPQQSLGVFLPLIGVPVEEGVFFLVTNTLIIQAVILVLDRRRLREKFQCLVGRLEIGDSRFAAPLLRFTLYVLRLTHDA